MQAREEQKVVLPQWTVRGNCNAIFLTVIDSFYHMIRLERVELNLIIGNGCPYALELLEVFQRKVRHARIPDHSVFAQIAQRSPRFFATLGGICPLLLAWRRN